MMATTPFHITIIIEFLVGIALLFSSDCDVTAFTTAHNKQTSPQKKVFLPSSFLSGRISDHSHNRNQWTTNRNNGSHQDIFRRRLRLQGRRNHNDMEAEESSFDPCGFANSHLDDTGLIYQYCRHESPHNSHHNNKHNSKSPAVSGAKMVAAAAAAVAVGTTEAAHAAIGENILSSGQFDPKNFQPVCPASDGFYRVLQSGAVSIVGGEKFIEYGPLIAGGLLRIRLELCVVESFFSEAIVPFISKNGISWILPFHETVETFLAGVVFALATAFILVGSSKILTVITFYTDFFVGIPCRTLGGFVYDRSTGKPVTFDIGIGPWFQTRLIGPPRQKDSEGKIIDDEQTENNPFLAAIDGNNNGAVVAISGTIRFIGQVSEIIRDVFEALDIFVGRYLVILSSGYIAVKFLHFKVFPDFP